MYRLDKANRTGMGQFPLIGGLGLVFQERDYVGLSPFDSDPYPLVTHCVKTALRKARSQYVCRGLPGEQNHHIKPGELYRHETGLSCGGQHGRWVGYRLCIGCMDKWLTEIGCASLSPNAANNVLAEGKSR